MSDSRMAGWTSWRLNRRSRFRRLNELWREERPAMAHTHEHDEGYFLDQIFSIALCGALGPVALLLYIGTLTSGDTPSMLGLILHQQFHPYVLAGGITLLVLVTIRAIAVWQLAGEAGKHAHDHHHHHDHDHD